MPKHELTRELWHVTVVNLEKIQGIEEYQRLTDIASQKITIDQPCITTISFARHSDTTMT